MRALRKGQATAFNLTRDIRGEARIGNMPSAGAEAGYYAQLEPATMAV
jgi:hypothetical protein